MAVSKKSDGLCERIHSAVSPFRPRTRHISLGSVSVTRNKNPVEISSEPVHVRNQFSLSETVPVEFRHANSKIESDEREIKIVRAQKFVKSGSRREDFAKVRSKKEEDHHHESRFSDYISKFKNRMIKTASNAGNGGAGGGASGSGGGSARRDSFNEKVTCYINQNDDKPLC